MERRGRGERMRRRRMMRDDMEGGAGEEGKVYYPVLLNPDIGWPEGVVGGRAIKAEHDWEMWRMLPYTRS